MQNTGSDLVVPDTPEGLKCDQDYTERHHKKTKKSRKKSRDGPHKLRDMDGVNFISSSSYVAF